MARAPRYSAHSARLLLASILLLTIVFSFYVPSSLQLARAESLADPDVGPDTPSAGIIKAPLLAQCILPKGRVQFAAPAVGDLDRSGRPTIVIGTTDGWVYAVKPDPFTCTVVWQFDVTAAINAVARIPSSTTVRGAPAIADLDGDGWNEVIVTSGAITSDHKNGGIVVLTHDGKLMPGWPQIPYAYYTDYAEALLQSPVIADLDGDGDMEIIAGANDNRVYAWHHDGTWVRGWPRFVFDTIWTSPVVGDLDNNGQPQVVIGVDAHRDPYFGSIDGGGLYIFGPNGTERPGFPKYINDIIQSSPALADLNRDGHLDIIFGGGDYYGPGATDGMKVFAWDRNGVSLPGWPQTTGGKTTGSPAIADLNNDGFLDVIIGSKDKKLYAWNWNGAPLPGWPMTPKDYTGGMFPEGRSPTVARYNAGATGNSQLKVFINNGWEITIIDANGAQLTWDGTPGNPQKKPTYYANYTVNASPVIADVNGDGIPDLIAAGGAPEGVGSNATIYVWSLPAGTTPPGDTYDWPMFKHNSTRSGIHRQGQPDEARVVQHTIPELMLPNRQQQVQVVFQNTSANTWSSAQSYRLQVSGAALNPSGQFTIPAGVTVPPGGSITFTFSITTPSTPGYYPLNVRMSKDGAGAFGSLITANIKVGNQPALYVLCSATTGGGVYAGGIAPPIAPPAGYNYWHRAPAFALGRLDTGYYLLDGTGFQAWTSGAQDLGTAAPMRPNLVDLVMGPDRQGFYAIDHNGNLAHTSGAINIPPLAAPFNDGQVTSFAITRDYKGVYVLHRSGEIRRSGTAVELGPLTPAFNNDVAKKIKLTKDGRGYYVLGGSGRVYRGGNAPEIAPAYAFHVGEDWARDFELTDDQQGYYLLDKDGYIHTAGTAIPLTYNIPPRCNDGAAKDLELADSRTASLSIISSAHELTMAMAVGDDLPSARLTLTSSAVNEVLDWTVRLEPNVSWLAPTPTSGKTPATVDVAVCACQPIGKHTTTLHFSGTDSTGQEVEAIDVPVTLHVWGRMYRSYLPMTTTVK